MTGYVVGGWRHIVGGTSDAYTATIHQTSCRHSNLLPTLTTYANKYGAETVRMKVRVGVWSLCKVCKPNKDDIIKELTP